MLIPVELRFIIYVLACYRLALLLYFDSGPYHLLDRFRYWCGVRADQHVGGQTFRWSENAHVGAVLNCPYCLSAWIALALGIVWYLNLPTLEWLILIAAVWGGATLLFERSPLKVEIEE